MTSPSEAGVVAQARLNPEKVALRLGGEELKGVDGPSLTYRALNERARKVAHALKKLGVGQGDRVAVMLPNGLEFFEATHGIGRIGAMVVPINTHFKSGEAGWILEDSGAKVVVIAKDLLPALADVPEILQLVVGPGGNYENALEVAPDGDVEIAGGDGWPTTMIYTSGTTGRPKGVAVGEGDFRRRAAGVIMMGLMWNFGADEVHLAVGPLYHAGPGAWAQMHLALGATVVVLPEWDASGALAAIERWGCTNTHMVPANFIRILELPAENRIAFELSTLRVVMHAAAPCPIPLKRATMDFFGADKVWEYYGASEGGGTMISPTEWLEHPGSVGRPFPGNDFRILDEDGSEVPQGDVGTIYAKPLLSSFRYHNDDTKTDASFRDGWFTVGDAGYLDADGYLYLTDRKADMVISGGVNIYPREVEDALFEHPDIADCAVLGVPDQRWGESLLAVIQPRAGALVSAQDVQSWCQDRLADYKAPRFVEVLLEIPRDPNGKVRKHLMCQEWIDRQSVPSTGGKS